MPATPDSKYLNMEREPTKPKTTYDKSKTQQRALTLPSENPVEV